MTKKLVTHSTLTLIAQMLYGEKAVGYKHEDLGWVITEDGVFVAIHKDNVKEMRERLYEIAEERNLGGMFLEQVDNLVDFGG